MNKKKLLTAATLMVVSTAHSQNMLPQAARLDSFLQQEIKISSIPGLAVAIVKDGKLVYQYKAGTANIEWDAPVTTHTAFQVASVTKLFTSTLVLKWIQEGKINLDDHVQTYLPEAPASWKAIQIKHLLSHQSGIPWPSGIGGFIGTTASGNTKPPTKTEIFNQLKDSALTFTPGAKESYMNGDHFVLQMIIEKIGGKPYPQLLQEEVFLPLGMKDSGFDLELRELPSQVMKPLPHKSQLFTKGKNGPYVFKSFYNANSYTSAALYLSLADAITWAVALDKGSLLHTSSIDSIQATMALNGSFTKMGWVKEKIYDQVTYGHSGGPGLGHILRVPEKKITIIVLNNNADVYPYIAPALVGICSNVTEIKEATLQTKMLNRGFDKRLE